MATNPRRLSDGEYDLRNRAAQRFLEVASARYPPLLITLSQIQVSREDFGPDVLVLLHGGAIVDVAPRGDRDRWERVEPAAQRWAEAHRIASPFVINAALTRLPRTVPAGVPLSRSFPARSIRGHVTQTGAQIKERSRQCHS